MKYGSFGRLSHAADISGAAPPIMPYVVALDIVLELETFIRLSSLVELSYRNLIRLKPTLGYLHELSRPGKFLFRGTVSL